MSKARPARVPRAAILLLVGLVLVSGLLFVLEGWFAPSSGEAARPLGPADAVGETPTIGTDGRQVASMREQGEPVAPLTRIVARDTRGRGVSGAGVFLADAERERYVGVTASDGVCTAELELGERGVVFVIATGYARGESRIDEDRPARIEVVLRAEATISGTVLGPEGPLSGVRVLARPFMASLEPHFVARALATDEESSSLHWTTSDPQGRYEIRNLEHGKYYWFFAGGNGCTLPRFGQGSFCAPADDCDLQVVPTYGALLTVVDRTGAPFVESDVTPTGGGARAWHAREGIASSNFSVSTVLAGLDPALRSQRDAFLYLCTTEAFESEAAPNTFEARHPGYEPRRVDFSAKPIHRALPTISVELDRIAAGWGTLAVVFSGALDVNGDARVPQGRVRLRSLGGSASLSYDVPLSERREHEISGVPFGAYDAQFWSHHGWFRFPEAEPARVVVSGEPSLFEVDLSATGGLRVIPTTADGEPYEGPIMLELSVGEPQPSSRGGWMRKGISQPRFQRGPYVIRGLRAGRYTLHVTAPVQSASDDWPGEILDVESAKTTTVSLDLSRFPSYHDWLRELAKEAAGD